MNPAYLFLGDMILEAQEGNERNAIMLETLANIEIMDAKNKVDAEFSCGFHACQTALRRYFSSGNKMYLAVAEEAYKKIQKS